MARLSSIGFELNSVSSGMEVDTVSGAGISISSSVKRSGDYSLRVTSSNGTRQGIVHQFASSASNGPFYLRTYIYIDTAPSSNNGIIVFSSANAINSAIQAYIYMTPSRTLVLNYNNAGSLTQIGSASSALSTATWYRVELLVDKSGGDGANIVDARLDGVSFASASNVTVQSGVNSFRLGTNMAGNPDTAGIIHFDDVALNDSTGSYQNTWAGAGSIVHLKPNADGDNTGWTNIFSGANDFSAVDEVTPNDGTDYLQSTVNGTIEDLDLEAAPAAINTNDAINVVSVGVRFAGNTTSSASTFCARIKASSGGTVEESGNLSVSNTTWQTNGPTAPRSFPLTLYDLPGSSTTLWTKSDLGTTQIGVKNTSNVVTIPQVSTLWLLVEYAPAATSPSASISPSPSPSASVSPSSSISPSSSVSASISSSPSASQSPSSSISSSPSSSSSASQSPSASVSPSSSISASPSPSSSISSSPSASQSPSSSISSSPSSSSSASQSPSASVSPSSSISSSPSSSSSASQSPSASISPSSSTSPSSSISSSPSSSTSPSSSISASISSSPSASQSPSSSISSSPSSSISASPSPSSSISRSPSSSSSASQSPSSSISSSPSSSISKSPSASPSASPSPSQSVPPSAIEFRYAPFRLIQGHQYRLSFIARSNISQNVQFTVKNSTGSTTSLNQTRALTANINRVLSFVFTAGASDWESKLSIFPSLAFQSFYLDKVVLIDLTKEKKEYRIMRIQGSVFPSAFIQTLTLREKTATESS